MYLLKGSRIHHINKSTPCVASKMNWNTKQDNGKFMTCTAVGKKAHLGMKRHKKLNL